MNEPVKQNDAAAVSEWRGAQMIELEIERARRADISEHPGSKIYFIQNVESGIVKIGTSIDVTRRLGDLSRSSGLELILLAAADGRYRVESLLHAQFKEDRVYGEWFRLGPRLLEWVERVKSWPSVSPLKRIAKRKPVSPRQSISAVRSAVRQSRFRRSCEQCKAPFEAQNQNARFCSGKCRTAGSRSRESLDVIERMERLERVFIATSERMVSTVESALPPNEIVGERVAKMLTKFVDMGAAMAGLRETAGRLYLPKKRKRL